MNNIPTKEERDSWLIEKAKPLLKVLKDNYPPGCCIIITSDSIKFYDCVNTINYKHNIVLGKDIFNLI